MCEGGKTGGKVLISVKEASVMPATRVVKARGILFVGQFMRVGASLPTLTFQFDGTRESRPLT